MTGTRDFNQPVSTAPLVTFRIVFGCLMFFSLLRFFWRGWVTSVYVTPKFHFTYPGFSWVQPLGETGMNLLFIVLIIASLMIALGFYYRIAIITFFLGFTYVELIDVTTYLNHYYFISLVAFIMIWLPAGCNYSLDARLHPEKRKTQVPAWTIGILRFQMAVVYIFAGLAKVNADWLLDAMPMRIWLPAKTHIPVVGPLMYQEWVAYLFSWFGAVYDLFIVFFLLSRKTRKIAYVFVLLFHLSTALFFPGIGMFPYVMITCSLIFFSGEFHERLLPRYKRGNTAYRYRYPQQMLAVTTVYVVLQLVIPMRYIFYPGHLYWHEEGYRFSWRVMLMEKAGSAYFTVKDGSHRQRFEVNNAEFLTPLQEKMMSTQPDMIVQYARHLAAVYRGRGVQEPEVFGEIYVTLNGSRSKLFIDTTVNLAAQQVNWKHYTWVRPWEKTQ